MILNSKIFKIEIIKKLLVKALKKTLVLVTLSQSILLHSTLYTVSFYKALWTSGYTSRAIGWGNPLAGECVTLLKGHFGLTSPIVQTLSFIIYISRAIGWGNPLAGECVTLLSNSAVTIIEES